jgi:hypothetical protein
MWVGGLADYDNDGWIDLFAANGHAPAEITIASASYCTETTVMEPSEVAMQCGSALAEEREPRNRFGDIDNDSDIDVIVNDLTAHNYCAMTVETE